MTIEDRLAFFIENYEMIATGTYSIGPKKFLKDGEVRFCRFCEKDESETSFKTIAHAIPECLGNHQLILLDECDACNKHFSEKMEDHLDKFTKPYRIAGQIRGKNGVPSYKTLNKKNRIDLKEKLVVQSQHDEDFFEIDHQNNEITINFHQEPHIPLAVYKALIKIALSIIESKHEVEPFRATIKWLLLSDHLYSVINPALVMEAFVPGPRPTNGVFVALFRRKELVMDVPYSIAVIAFGNVILQFLVPSDIDKNRKMTVQMPFLPSPFELCEWPFGSIKYGSIDLSGTEKIKRNFPVKYSFDEIVEVDPSEL